MTRKITGDRGHGAAARLEIDRAVVARRLGGPGKTRPILRRPFGEPTSPAEEGPAEEGSAAESAEARFQQHVKSRSCGV